MLQDIEPLHLRNEYLPQPPQKADYVIVSKEGGILLKKTQEGFLLPRVGDYPALPYTYLFSIGEYHFYMLKGAGELPDFQYENTRYLRTAAPRWLAYGALIGIQLARWYENRQFCGRCGAEMIQDHKERMLRCPCCRTMEYPKLCPAVIVAITHKDKLLLTQYAGRTGANYALVAGFAEVGETIEETVRREVMEEVGLSIRNLQYYKSQPWPFSDSLLFGFYAELDGDDETITLQEEELAMAKWFARTEIPVEEDGVSLTNEMIMRFKNLAKM